MKTHGIGGELLFFCRNIEKIMIGNLELSDLEMDFGDIDPSGRYSRSVRT